MRKERKQRSDPTQPTQAVAPLALATALLNDLALRPDQLNATIMRHAANLLGTREVILLRATVGERILPVAGSPSQDVVQALSRLSQTGSPFIAAGETLASFGLANASSLVYAPIVRDRRFSGAIVGVRRTDSFTNTHLEMTTMLAAVAASVRDPAVPERLATLLDAATLLSTGDDPRQLLEATLNGVNRLVEGIGGFICLLGLEAQAILRDTIFVNVSPDAVRATLANPRFNDFARSGRITIEPHRQTAYSPLSRARLRQ